MTRKGYQDSWNIIADEKGTPLEYLSFDPWGRRRNPKTWTFDDVPVRFIYDRGYTGHEHLDKFGLINMNGRVYDPAIARFLSPDPFIQNPGFSQSYNRYSYCLNNPFKYTDPSGYNYINYREYWATMIADGSGQGGGGYFMNPQVNGYQNIVNNPQVVANRSVYANFMLMGSSNFQRYYGISSSDYNSIVIPNYKYLPQYNQTFQQNSIGQMGIYGKEFSLGNVVNNGNIKDAGIPHDGGGIGIKFIALDAQGGGGDLATWSFIAGAASLGYDSWQNLAYDGYNYIPSKGPNAGKPTSVWKMNKSGNFALKNGSKFPNSANAASKLMATSIVKIGGIALTTVGLGFTVYDIRQNGLNLSNGTDFVMGGVAYVPGWGWAVSGGYFIGKACYEIYPSIPADYWGRPGTGFSR